MNERAASAAPATPTALLRPALEAAVAVARDGESADPPQAAPAALRRFLRFARLPAPALEIARKVIEEDDEFRERVAARITERDIGEAGWLWLRRPDGWHDRLDQLRRQRAEAEHHEREERAERDASRRLGHAEDRARRAEALAALRTDELAAARAELAEFRRQAEQLLAQLEDADVRVGELRDQRNQAVRRLKDIEGELARRAAELRQARHEIRVRDAELAASVAEPTPPPPPPTPPPQSASARVVVDPASDLDRAALATIVARAAAAAEQLSAALADAAKVVEPSEPSAASAPPPASVPAPSRRTNTRTPVRLPPGVLDDSVAAADHLCRTAGVLVLVDGYNVSKAAWPTLPIARQRARLVDALAELHARTAAEVDVVFDGSDHQPIATSSRTAVRVRFSPDGVEADDVLIELVDRASVERPVAVVSSDNRVRDAARQRGANVIAAKQLLALLGR